MNKLTRYYVYAFLSGLQFTFTTWLAFVLARGANPGWAESAYHLAIFLGEVPTGAVADLLGRRRSMQIGLLLGVVIPLSFYFIHDTFTACVVMALSGLSGTFLSGADQALLYETAREIGGEDLARRALARFSAVQMTAMALSPSIAGLLFQWREWAPYAGRSVVALLTLACVWGMKEKLDHLKKAERTSVWGQTRTAVQVIRSNRIVIAMLLFSWLYNTAFSMTGQYGQAYFPFIGLSRVVTGFIFTAGLIGGSGGGWLAERVSSTFARRAIRFAPVLVGVGIIGMGFGMPLLGVACYVGLGLVDGMLWPIFQSQFNAAIPSEQRATILSFQAAGFSMVMSAAFPAASYLHPITAIYTVTGIAALILACVWMFRRWAH